MQIKEFIKSICVKQLDKVYEKQLAAKKADYHDWVCEKEKEIRSLPIVMRDEFVVICQKNGQLSKHAIACLSETFERLPYAKLLYGDEDLLNAEGRRECPWCKPCWSPDTYLAQFYVGSVVAVRKRIWDEHKAECGLKALSENVSIYYFEQASQIRDLLDGIIKELGGFEKSCEAIVRVPHVLFHVENRDVWKEYLQDASDDIDTEKAQGLVSVIIPSKDNPKMLKKCFDSLSGLTDIEIILVDNGSSPENRSEIESFLGEAKYLYHPMEFNFSKMCNMGAQAAKGEYLLFLNDDIEAAKSDWLEVMKEKAACPYVGAVGLKLYYPDSNIIQHAGIVNIPVGPVHKLCLLPDDEDYYFGFNRGARNCCAVTGACLMIKKRKFEEMGGFLEQLSVCYNDVDLCFRLYEQGYQNVVINECYAWHHESISRGSDNENPEKLARFKREWNLLYELHLSFVEEDPYYPAEMDRWSLNNKVQPAYIYTEHLPQEPDWKKYEEKWQLRYDNCLMARVEMYDSMMIQGYGIVLGDDNACYERYVVLSPDAESNEISEGSLVMQVDGKYRYELEENVPDQKNVALCGFCIGREKEQLSSGRYKAGMIAVNKVTGLKLFSWCGKVLDI